MSSNRTVRAGIVGCSGIAAARPTANPTTPLAEPMPQSHAAAYALFPNVEVVAVCDLVEERMEAFRRLWADRWPEIHTYTDVRDLIGAHELDILSVVTSDDRHAEIVVAAAEAGIPAIWCEKPLATTLEDADRMIAACDAAGTVLSVDHTRRWSPLYHKARELVRNGEIGEVGLLTGVLGGPRAMLFRNGTHCIDMLNFFAESDPAWVWGVNDPEYADYVAYAGDGGRTAALEPGVLGFIEYANGVRAFYRGTKHSTAGFGVDVVGTKGTLIVRDTGATLVRSATETVQVPPERYVHDWWAGAVEELLRLLDDGGEPVSSGREARKTVAIFLGFLESHRRGNVCVEV